ncbi:uncharacterized protein LOC113568512 [Electrophorus electricus]|nr:uncharacterized protein LOC113568512 [Electrophorus electricus]
MESYAEFRAGRLDGLRAQARCSTRRDPRGALSTLQFHGKHLPLPRLSEHQRSEMAKQRQKAVDRERERNTLKNSSLLVQLQKKRYGAHGRVEQDADSSPLGPQAPPPSRTRPASQPSPSAWRRDTLRLLNRRMERTGIGSEERREAEKMSGAATTRSDTKQEVGEECDPRKGKAMRVPECPLVAESGTHVTSADLSCSVAPQLPGSLLSSLSVCASLMGSYAQLPSPQPSGSPVRHLQRPRAASAGRILISAPVSESELRPHGLNRLVAAQSDLHSSESPGNRIPPRECQSDSSVCIMPPTSGGEWDCSCSELSGTRLTSISTSTPRRAVILPRAAPPTQPGTAPQRQHNGAPCPRSRPAPLNQSYDVEGPYPSLLRPQVNSGTESPAVPSQQRPVLGGWQQRPLVDEITLGSLADAVPQDKALDEKIQQSEALDQHFGGDHPHHLSNLLKEQEKETQHLLQGALCRLTAVARGFLTRRLLQTDKIQNLHKIIRDSRELIRSFQCDSQRKRASFTTQDLCLQRRVRAQLHTALRDVHDIFCVWPLRDKLALLQRNRELQTEQKLREMEKARRPRDGPTLTSATQKSLDRRRTSKKIPKKTKTPPERDLLPAQSQTTVLSSQKFKAARVVRRPVESFRAHLSLG